MLIRYYLYMGSVSLLGLLFGEAQMLFGATSHQAAMFLAMAAALGVANIAGGWLIFRPVQRFVSLGAETRRAEARLGALAALCAFWTFAASVSIMTAPFAADFLGGRIPASALAYQGMLMCIHALFMALFIYFLTGDYSAWLKGELYRARGIELPVRRSGVLAKLLAVFFATAVVPLALVLFETFLAGRSEELEGLAFRKALVVDTAAALAMAAVAVVFVRRRLLRPLELLLASVRRVDAGDLEAHTPVVSDDEIGVLTVQFNQMVDHLREKERLRETLGIYVPARVADAIAKNDGAVRPQKRTATVLFTDIENFTRIAEDMAPEDVMAMLNDYFSLVVDIVEDHGGTVTQFQGDTMLVCYNVPIEDARHAANAIRSADEIVRLTGGRVFGRGTRIATRVGINTGVVIAGPVGARHRASYTVHGDAVNVAARLEQLNKDYGTRVMIAGSTVRLAGNEFQYRSLGAAAMRGKSGRIPVYTLHLTEVFRGSTTIREGRQTCANMR